MRRPILVATFVLTGALAAGWAQMRSGMRGFGAAPHFGFAARGPMMQAAPTRSSFASRGPMMRSAPVNLGHAPGRGLQFAGGFRPPNHFHPQPAFNHGHHHHGFNFIPAVNWRYRYPFSYGGYYSPWYGDWWGSSYDSYNSSRDDYAQTQMLRQIDDLSQEVQRLRQEHENSQLEEAAPPAPTPAPVPQRNAEPAKLDSGLPVVLVFFDKKIQEVKNYAVMNEMLVVFDGTRTTKIPLRDVDLAATMKLNDERGVDFQIPN